jgi:hypothetical protein
LRKTGYLFATWGVLKSLGYYNLIHSTTGSNTGSSMDTTNAQPTVPPAILELAYANILESARHASIQNAGTYQVSILILLNFMHFSFDIEFSY